MISEDNKKYRVSLSVKLSAVTTGMILLVTLGLMIISNVLYSRKIRSMYYELAESTARANVEYLVPEEYEYFWSLINTDEFREIHKKAQKTGDETIIIDWMKSKESGYYRDSPDEAHKYSLYFDYLVDMELLQQIQSQANIKYAYVQYMENGVTYNIIDPDIGLMGIGTIEENMPEFEKYGDNQRVPTTVSHTEEYGWLCSAYEPIVDEETGEAFGMLGIDIDMDTIVTETRWFLLNSVIFVLILTAVCIAVDLYLIRRIATKPLGLLAKATGDFATGKTEYTRDDVIEVDIRSHDEIKDLYMEIRDMQGRIVDYMDDLARYTSEKERRHTEMSLAASIQSGMLPGIDSVLSGRKEFDLFASMDPAKDVGGDFYDFFFVDEDHLVLVIADVSGKGVPAALFMMASMILIRDHAKMGGSPAEILGAANAQICNSNVADMFVTVWIGILEISTGHMRCANAGHEYPAIYRREKGFALYKAKHGAAVGVYEGIKFREYELDLNPGDVILVYTDGVPEASNASEEFYGTDRLISALNLNTGNSPESVINRVKKDVEEFVNGAEQFDDLTMLCLTYNGG
ncbi:MAG: SpoIIE family protein phosphatase [Lachnospiraceae bacterium]|nr:SpoIIE family protein phosphatase [Lachnospiraceae bacterium]